MITLIAIMLLVIGLCTLNTYFDVREIKRDIKKLLEDKR